MSIVGLFLQPLPIRVTGRSKTGKILNDGPAADFLLAIQDSARCALDQGIAWTSLMDLLPSSENENLRSAATTMSPNHQVFDANVTFYEHSATGKASPFAIGAVRGVEPLIPHSNDLNGAPPWLTQRHFRSSAVLYWMYIGTYGKDQHLSVHHSVCILSEIGKIRSSRTRRTYYDAGYVSCVGKLSYHTVDVPKRRCGIDV